MSPRARLDKLPAGVDIREWDRLPMRWRAGEHVTAIAPTGAGKSTLLAALASLRTYVAVLATKPADPELRRLFPDPPYPLVREWPRTWLGEVPEDTTRVIVWPPLADLSRESTDAQALAIRDALNGAFRQGGWTMVVDELHHLADSLGLTHELVNLWRMGRSNNISVLAATQRPAFVPLEAYGQASHLFIGRMNDRRDLDRIDDFVPADRDLLRHVVPRLPKFAWLYVRINDGYLCITRPPRYPDHPTPTETP